MMKWITTISILFTVAALSTTTAQESEGIQINAGGGLNYLSFTNDQQVIGGEIKSTFNSIGFNGFVDITKYFTLILGYRIAAGDASQTLTTSGKTSSTTATNSVSQLEIGAELKYPFSFGDSFSISPKIGLDDIIYLGGAVGGTTPSTSDAKQQLSPLFLTLGADINYAFTKNWFVRIPFDLGLGLNAKLSDSYYGGRYSGASVVGLRIGADVGYAF